MYRIVHLINFYSEINSVVDKILKLKIIYNYIYSSHD